MGSIGRPKGTTKLTPELQEEIVKYIAEGNYAIIACQAVGISNVTYYDWLKRGKTGEEPFLSFLNAIKKAKAEAIMGNVKIVLNAAAKSWQAAAWWLERTSANLFGRKESVKVKKEVSLGDKDSKALKSFLKKEKLLTPEQQEKFLKFAIELEEKDIEEKKEYKA